MLGRYQPGRQCTSSGAPPTPRPCQGRQTGSHRGRKRGCGSLGAAAVAAHRGSEDAAGRSRSAAAAAPTDDVTERPSREPWRGGCSRALPGRSLGRIMEANPAPAPDSVSALLRPSSPFILLVLFPPPCFLASLPPWPRLARGGPARLLSFQRRGLCERVCWCLRRQL